MLLEDKTQTFPLVKTSVEASVGDDDASVFITQTFSNPGFNQPKNNKLEAFYKFPLQSNAAVSFFETTFFSASGKELRKLKGKAKKNEVATKEYQKALRSGLAAQLLEQDFENSPDVFNLSVGNISSEVKTINVGIGYFVPLIEEGKPIRQDDEEKEDDDDDDGFDEDSDEEVEADQKIKGNVKRFLIPAVMASRFGEMKIKPGQKVNVSKKGCAFEIKVNISLTHSVLSVESPSHKIMPKFKLKGRHTKSVVKFKDKKHLQKDFVLSIVGEQSPDSMYLIQDRNRVQAKATADSTNNLFTGSFGDSTIAKLTFRCLDSDVEVSEQNFVFLVDRSGSMDGSEMESCKKALEMCLMSLPKKYLFNICSFGDTYSFLFSKSQEASEDNVKKALAHVKAMSANMGGTKILTPLKKIIAADRSGMPNVVLVMTDGEVWDTEGLLQDVKQDLQTHDVKIFTCGIGSGVSTHLVEGLAKVGGGTATFITENEDFNTKLLWQMEQGVYAAFNNLRVDMGGLKLSKADLAWDADSMLPASVLSRETLSFYVAVDTTSVLEIERKLDSGDPVESIKLTGVKDTDKSGKRVIVAEITFQDALNASGRHMIIPALCEQVRLAEMSDKEESVDRAVNLCLIGNLVSKFTCLVAVEKNTGTEPAKKQKIVRDAIQDTAIAIQDTAVAIQSRGGPILANETTTTIKAFKYSAPAKVAVPQESFGRGEPIYRPDIIVSSSPWVPASAICTRVKKRDLGSSDYKKAEPLVALQNIDGSFQATDELAKLVGKESFGAHVNTPGFGTAVAIAFLEKKLGSGSPGWKLFRSKAIRFLESNVPHHGDVLEEARKFVLEKKPVSSANAFMNDFF